MGSAMESFCCANKKDGNNPQNTNETLNSNFEGLPTNEIITGNNLNKILQLSSFKKNENPFTDYELLEKLGEGECSEVYVIKNKKDKNIYVLKKMKRNKESNLDDDEIRKQIEALKQLNHSYINKIYEYLISDDYIFLIEDFCSEGNLQDKLNKIKIFPEFITKIIMFQIFKSLIYLGSKNVIHGNLKLENILLELNNINNQNKVNKKNEKFDRDKFLKAIDDDVILINNALGNKNANYRIDIKQIDSLKLINKKINESQKRVESSQMSTGLSFGSLKNKEEKLKAIPRKIKSNS